MNLGRERIHYGSIQETELTRHQSSLDLQGIDLDSMDIQENTKVHTIDQQSVLEEFERKRIAKKLFVPTDDKKVRNKLQKTGEPQCLFGEGNVERRERLRSLLFKRLEEFGDTLSSDEQDYDDDDEEEQDEEFFTFGDEALLDARRFITEYSLPRAKQRIQLQADEMDIPIPNRKKIKHEWFSHLKTFQTHSSQFGDSRPLSSCTFSPNSQTLATASFSGTIKLWSVPSSTLTHTFKGHNERVSGIAFSPHNGGVDLASGAIDGSCFLWNVDKEYPVAELEGHAQRVSRVAFHPDGRFLGTASFDSTWRLWDIETTTELLLQEGHSRELFAIGFQGDGSLVATGGKDTLGRIWDLRTGRSVMLLTGHIKSLLTLDWSPNGHQLATGSEDNTIRIWDLRGKGGGCVYNIPAHTGLVSQVKYFNNGFFNSRGDEDEDLVKKQLLNGSCLVSASYDGTCKIWTEGDWKSIKVLSGLEGKLMCCDVSSDAKYIATASYDRTFKLFSAEG